MDIVGVLKDPDLLGHKRVLVPAAIDDAADEITRLRAELAECSAVIEAARCIRHWHDAPNEGMVVSGSHVRELWKALNNYDAARRGEGEHAKLSKSNPSAPPSPACGSMRGTSQVAGG